MSDVTIDIEYGTARATVVNSAFVVGLIVAGPCRLLGWAIRETTGAAIASAEITSGQQVVGEVGVPAGQNDVHTMPKNGVYCPGGITITSVAGAWTGCIYYEY